MDGKLTAIILNTIIVTIYTHRHTNSGYLLRDGSRHTSYSNIIHMND